MDLNARLEALIVPSLDGMGYELVRVMLQGRERPTLQVMAERKDGLAMTVEDCADISRSLSALFDVDDPIQGAYTLEVSSPGIDRPLTRRKDFERWAGFEAKLESSQPVDGRKRFKGLLKGLDDTDCVIVAIETGEVRIPLAEVRAAKLVITDALIAAATKDQEG
jgi:ribosome maturation factor RimP